jgi:hypothetical protein
VESSWDRLKRQLQDFYQVAAEKTDELARVSARRIDVLSLRRQLSQEMVALGSRVYEMIEKEKTNLVSEDPEVLRRIETARRLEQEIAESESEIEEIRSAAAERRAAQARAGRGMDETGEGPGSGPSF